MVWNGVRTGSYVLGGSQERVQGSSDDGGPGVPFKRVFSKRSFKGAFKGPSRPYEAYLWPLLGPVVDDMNSA